MREIRRQFGSHIHQPGLKPRVVRHESFIAGLRMVKNRGRGVSESVPQDGQPRLHFETLVEPPGSLMQRCLTLAATERSFTAVPGLYRKSAW
jgi:hypothetical protein